jgi:hypothetical protein
MPNTQTLMLYFDITQEPGKKHGRFSDDDPNGVRSKVWLDQLGNSTPDTRQVTVNLRDNVDFSINLDTKLPTGWTVKMLRMTAVLWRVHDMNNNAIYDSPFADPANATKQEIVFDRNFATAGTGVVDFSVPIFNSGAGNIDRYIIQIGVTLDANDGTQIHRFTAAQDPQMAVNC